MRNSLSKDVHRHIQLISLILIAVTLPFSTRFNSIFTIVLLINWLWQGNFHYRFEQLKINKTFFVISSFYLVNIFGMLYTSNYDTGVGILLKRVTLLLFPLLLSDFKFDKKVIDKISLAFILSVLAAVIYSAYKVYEIKTQGGTVPGSFEGYYQYNYFRELLGASLKIQPTYFSIFILFSIFLIGHLLLTNNWYKNLFLLFSSILIMAFLFAFTLLLSARMPLIAFASICVMIFVYYLVLKRQYMLLLLGSIILLCFSFWLLSLPIINHRFVEIKTTEWKPPVGIHHNSTNIRIGILKCSYEEIKKNWFFGTGTGDMQDTLNKCYKANNYSDVLYKLNYNTHSAYIDALLMLGILGLITLISVFAFNFKLAFKTKTYIYIIFNLLFVITCISESLLNSQKGIVFFSLFNTLYAYYAAKKITIKEALVI